MTIEEELLARAVGARSQAYAPYSEFAVGAALLCADGEVHLGCNVENASYGLTSCAERNAVFSAVAAGQREFVMLALVVKDGGTPCGACRQVLNEFAPELPIVIGDGAGELLQEISLDQLLPNAFGPGNL